MATKGRERRRKRRAQRKLRKNGPEKQFYGGSEQEFESAKSEAARTVSNSEDDYNASRKTVKTEMSRLRKESDEADKNYASDRQGYQSSIAGIGNNAQQAIAMRNNALAANDLNAAANTAINQNNTLANQRLAQTLGIQARNARGLAGSMGEGSALAMQQAMASAGANAGDLTAQNNLTQAQLANDMRYGAAQQQTANALGVADANAGTQYDAGLQTANANAGLLQGTDARQQNLLGMRSGLAELGVSSALGNQGQQLNNAQTINTSQLGVDQQNAAAKYAAAQANSPMAKLTNIVGAHDKLKGTAPGANLFGFGNK